MALNKAYVKPISRDDVVVNVTQEITVLGYGYYLSDSEDPDYYHYRPGFVIDIHSVKSPGLCASTWNARPSDLTSAQAAFDQLKESYHRRANYRPVICLSDARIPKGKWAPINVLIQGTVRTENVCMQGHVNYNSAHFREAAVWCLMQHEIFLQGPQMLPLYDKRKWGSY